MDNLIEAIKQLKKEKNAIILGHYYQKGEIQDIADYVGDSLALAQWAARTEADIIVMCGVHFIGEPRGALSRQEGAGARYGGRLFVGRQLSGRQIQSVCQRASRIYGDILCEHNGCRKGGDRCGGNFYQCKADCGKLPQR